MATISPRARWGAAIAAVAFAGGVLMASAMDWTHHGFAQGRPSASEVRPMADASNAFVSIADHATPAVVSIVVDTKTRVNPRSRMQIPRGQLPPGMEQFFDLTPQRQQPVEEASGSGFIVTRDGYILTNNHVITGNDRTTVADKIAVKLADGRVFDAKVIGNDPTTDIAVLKIDGSNFATLPLGDDTRARVGEWVLAIGNPLGQLESTVTAGIISAKNRSLPGLLGNDRYAISDLLQTDAAINPGNSGGPLINSSGEVIGINNAIASETGYYAGYGFAVPITLAKKVMDDLIAHGHVRFGVLGVVITEVDNDAAAVAKLDRVAGAQVTGFNPDTPDNPARKAGLQEGDIIVSGDGTPVEHVASIQRLVRNHAPGQSVKLDVVRYGKRMTFNVVLAERPSDSTSVAVAAPAASEGTTIPAGSKLGIELGGQSGGQERIPGYPAHGVRIASVAPLGPSFNKLSTGWVITGVLFPQRRAINTTADLQQFLSTVKTGDYVSFNVSAPTVGGIFQSSIVNIRIGQ